MNPFFVFLWSVLILDERKEGWGGVKRRFGAVEPVMFAYGKETLFRSICRRCLMHVVKEGVLKRYHC